VDGNVSGLSANSGGTLVFTDEDTMTFRTGLTSVPVKYTNVTKAALGAVKTQAHDVPLYKVWALHKRFAPKTQTQLLVVDFKTEEGEEKQMTLELEQSSAADVLATIESHTAKGVVLASNKPTATSAKAKSKAAQSNQAWWGDDFWRTTRNADKWNKAGTAADTDRDHQ